MGSTSDKLNKIIQSKNAIKNAINNKGGSVTDSTPLADYAQAIENIPSGGGGKRIKIGGFGGTYEAATIHTILDNGQNALIYKNLYSGSDGFPVNFTGIKPRIINDQGYATKPFSGVMIRDCRYRQVFIVNKQNLNTSYSAKTANNAFMITQRSSDGSMSGYWTYLYLNLDVNKSGSSYFGKLYPSYYYNGNHYISGPAVNLGDKVDITYEYIDNGYTLQITLIINDDTPTVYRITNDEWSLCYDSGDRSLGEVSFAGNRTDANSSPSGINCTLLEGTSIFNKTTNKYIWQLFEEIEE